MQHLKRSVVTAAAVGTVLAVAATTTPAMVTSAPQLRNVACSDVENYPSQVATTTDLTLAQGVAPYGAGVRATVEVDSTVATPEGDVRITVIETGWTRTVSLNSAGIAGVTLPAGLPAQATYTIRAVFKPACAEFRGSRDTAYLTVQKAGTDLAQLKADDRRRGGRPTVTGVVNSTRSPGGKVVVTITRGAASKTESAWVQRIGGGQSTFAVEFGPTWKVGEWTVEAEFQPTRNFRGSAGTTTFRIYRGR